MGCFLCAKHISIETTDVVSTLWSLRSTVKLESNNDLNKSKKVELPNDKGKVASLVAEMVKTLPAVQETCVWSLGREKSPREGKGYPLQYSCLENSMNRGAWWAQSMGLQRVRLDWVTNIQNTKERCSCLLWGWSALFNIYRLKCWSNVNSTITEIAGVVFEQIYEYRSLAKLTHKIYHHKGLLVQVKEWGFDPSGFWRVNCFIPVFLGSTTKMYLLP